VEITSNPKKRIKKPKKAFGHPKKTTFVSITLSFDGLVVIHARKIY
jgi:hypothetical protein